VGFLGDQVDEGRRIFDRLGRAGIFSCPEREQRRAMRRAPPTLTSIPALSVFHDEPVLGEHPKVIARQRSGLANSSAQSRCCRRTVNLQEIEYPQANRM